MAALIKAGTGLSINQETDLAAQEASETALEQAGVDRADWGVVFSTSEHRAGFGDLVQIVSEELGTLALVGCTGTGVLTQEGEVEGEAGVAVLAVSSEEITAEPYLFRDEGDGGLTVGCRLGEALSGSASPDDLLVLLPDPYHIQPDRLLRAIGSRTAGMPVVGAAAGEDGQIGATYQFCGAEVSTGAVAAMHLSGRFRRTTRVTQGCRPIGDPCVVTRARGNAVVTLDGRPALQVLIEQLPPSLLEDAPGLLQNLFVALPPHPSDREFHEGEYLVRNILAVEPDHASFSVAGQVVEGQFILFVLRAAESAREDLKRTLELVDPARTGSRYSFGLYFNCAGRGRSLYRLPGVDSAYLSATLRAVPIAGVFGNAEMAPLRGENHLFTYTGVLSLFGDEGAG